MIVLRWIRAVLSFPFALAFFNFNWHEATWEFRELLRANLSVGDKITILHHENRNSILCGFRKSPWGGRELLVEMDEPFPYVGRENPRRKIWMHEDWLEE